MGLCLYILNNVKGYMFMNSFSNLWLRIWERKFVSCLIDLNFLVKRKLFAVEFEFKFAFSLIIQDQAEN